MKPNSYGPRLMCPNRTCPVGSLPRGVGKCPKCGTKGMPASKVHEVRK